MTHRERIDAAVRGERPDRVPVALWRHFPGDDQRAEKMARRHVAHYRAYDPDLLKVTPASGYYGDDWGLRAGYKPNREGVRTTPNGRSRRPLGLGAAQGLDLSQGAHGREAHAVRLIAEAVGREVAVFETVFSPLSIARTLAGSTRPCGICGRIPRRCTTAWRSSRTSTAEFVREVMAAGADGIFFSTQMATTSLLTEEEYEEFGRPYDLRILDAVDGGLMFLHLHGENVMFDLVSNYPIQILNWHARETPPTIADARARVSTCLACGINAWNTLAKAAPEAVAQEVRSAIADTGRPRAHRDDGLRHAGGYARGEHPRGHRRGARGLASRGPPYVTAGGSLPRRGTGRPDTRRAAPMIALSTGSLYTYGTARTARFAADAGFDGLEIMVDQRWDTRDPAYLSRMARDVSLPILAIHAPSRGGSAPWGDEVERVRGAVTLAQAVGARTVVVHPPVRYRWISVRRVPFLSASFLTPFRQRSPYLRWLETDLAAYQAASGVTIAVENMPRHQVAGSWSVNLFELGRVRDLRAVPAVALDTTHLGTWDVDLLAASRGARGPRRARPPVRLRRDAALPPGRRAGFRSDPFFSGSAGGGSAGSSRSSSSPRRSAPGTTVVVAERLARAREFCRQNFRRAGP